MDFDWAYEMPGYDAGNLEQYENMGYDQPQMQFDYGTTDNYGAWDNFGGGGLDFSGLEGGSWQMSQTPNFQVPQQALETPNYGSGFPQMDEVPQAPEVASSPATQVGGAGGSAREEDSWYSRLAKSGLGMGVGAGTSVLGNLAQSALAPKSKSSAPAATGAVPSAMPMAPAQPQYTPEKLEPLPGTKASPLISGRPTSVKGSAGLKERRPTYGGFSMY